MATLTQHFPHARHHGPTDIMMTMIAIVTIMIFETLAYKRIRTHKLVRGFIPSFQKRWCTFS